MPPFKGGYNPIKSERVDALGGATHFARADESDLPVDLSAPGRGGTAAYVRTEGALGRRCFGFFFDAPLKFFFLDATPRRFGDDAVCSSSDIKSNTLPRGTGAHFLTGCGCFGAPFLVMVGG